MKPSRIDGKPKELRLQREIASLSSSNEGSA